jgi:hypothetical protein
MTQSLPNVKYLQFICDVLNKGINSEEEKNNLIQVEESCVKMANIEKYLNEDFQIIKAMNYYKDARYIYFITEIAASDKIYKIIPPLNFDFDFIKNENIGDLFHYFTINIVLKKNPDNRVRNYLFFKLKNNIQ